MTSNTDSVLDEYRRRAVHDIRVIVVVDGVGAEALVVDEYELEDNNAIVSMLYHRVMGEINRVEDREAKIRDAIKVAREVSGTHKVVELNEATLAAAIHPAIAPVVSAEDRGAWTVIEVNEPPQWRGEEYNDWMYRKARWTRWASTSEPSFTDATTAEITKWQEWLSTRKDI